MSKDKNILQVLVTSDKTNVLDKGEKMSALRPGQIGVFDHSTHLSIDGTEKSRDIYLAVGVDTNGDGTSDSFATSSGQKIKVSNINSYAFQPYKAGKPMVLELKDFVANCNTDYHLKIQFTNQAMYRLQGFVPFTVTYSVRTAPCDECSDDCPSGVYTDLAKSLIEAINKDNKGLVKAEAFNTTTDAVVTDIDAFVNTNKAVNTDGDPTTDILLGIRLTSIPLPKNKSFGINTRYHNPRFTVLEGSIQGGFEANGKLTVKSNPEVEEGNGYDIKQREYESGCWDNKIGSYRVYAVNGMPKQELDYLASETKKYGVISLDYIQRTSNHGDMQKSDLSTQIAIPNSDTKIRDDLFTILNNIVEPLGFGAMDATGGIK